MDGIKLILDAAAHVRGLFQAHESSVLPYHSVEHTEEVVTAAERISGHYALNELEYLAVKIAAWFHDVGYLFTHQEDHEEKSAELADAFLSEKQASEALRAKVKECILATKMPQQPASLPAQILCDADLFHLGTLDFVNKNEQVRQETELRTERELQEEVWNRASIQFLERHCYHTDFCRQALQEGKADNLQQLLKAEHTFAPTPAAKDKKEKKEKKPKKTERGVETMFRVMSSNHIRLSDMADSKAQILLTISSIIVSLLVSVVFRKLEEEPRLIVPAVILTATSLTTVVFTILVTLPKLTQGRFNKEDIEKKRANLLFFGNYHRMPVEEYEWALKRVMADSDFLYGSLIRDNYNLGVILERKYRKLRVAYSVFMFGFIASVLSFAIAQVLIAR